MYTIKVFEHQTIRAGDKLRFYRGGSSEMRRMDEKYITALWKMYDERKRPFFTPTRNGIKFCEWVGVVKVLNLAVEILPKADNSNDFDSEVQQLEWQSILIDMLRICRSLHTPSISEASLKLKSNSILDLYIERLITEVNYLLHSGLIKRYRKQDLNSNSLKGRLMLDKHVTKNLVHKELFYIRTTVYDTDHLIHQIIGKALKILPLLCNNQYLISSCYQLQIGFPEVRDVRADAACFEKLLFDRKSEPYRTALQIAKLLLLNYRPDISGGSSNSIAILFDMNKLWEEFIYRMLQKANDGSLVIHNQRSTKFWAHLSRHRFLKPDLVIEQQIKGNRKYVVIDTKWKNVSNNVKNVDMNDLRQMFAYHHYFDSINCYLLYPGIDNLFEGTFVNQTYFKTEHIGTRTCGVIVIKAWEGIGKTLLKKDVGDNILKAVNLID